MVLPGSKVATVPSVEVVVVVVAVVSVATGFLVVVVDSVVVVLVCAKAKGAIAAQARMSMLFFIIVPSIWLFYNGIDSFQTPSRAAHKRLCPLNVVLAGRERCSMKFGMLVSIRKNFHRLSRAS